MNAAQKRRLLRLVNLLGLIKDKTGVRAKDLATQCGVSIRTFFNYLKILQRAGFPVFHKKGYRIFSNFTLEPLYLTLDELLTVRSGANRLIYYQQFSDSAASVLKKLEKILLNKSSGLLKVLDSDKTQPTLFEMLQDSPDLFGVLKDSIQKKQAVVFYFIDKKNNFSEKIFWPRQLAFNKGGWIVQAEEVKTALVEEIPFEKIQKLVQTNLSFKNPEKKSKISKTRSKNKNSRAKSG
jgi:predicted DNA-binding transcriptional regulator YafY